MICKICGLPYRASLSRLSHPLILISLSQEGSRPGGLHVRGLIRRKLLGSKPIEEELPIRSDLILVYSISDKALQSQS